MVLCLCVLVSRCVYACVRDCLLVGVFLCLYHVFACVRVSYVRVCVCVCCHVFGR